MNINPHVCPAAISGILDNRVRRWLQDPRRILAPYVREGMEVLEVGCGPGFFTGELARLVGEKGKVVAVDLQEEMLRKVREKIRGSGFEGRIVLHRCEEDRLGVSGSFDLVFLFYVVHEVADKRGLFRQLQGLLKDGGVVYLAEPPIHVSGRTFERILGVAQDAGFKIMDRPGSFPDKVAVLKRA